MMSGIEGKSYIIEDGKMRFTEWALNSEGGFQPMRSLGAENTLPHVETYEYFEAAWTAWRPDIWDEVHVMITPYVVPRFPVIMPTVEETDFINPKMAEINTYLTESVTRFVIGKDNLDNWDQFTSKLKEIGVEALLPIKQAQYDRYMK